MKLKNKNNNKVSIKYKVFGYFTIFIVCTIAFLWLFQIVFLNEFYKMIKVSEIKSSAQIITRNIENENINDLLSDIAQNQQMCIKIVSINTGMVISVDGADKDCLLHKLPVSSLYNYYELVKVGEKLEIINVENTFNPVFSFPWSNQKGKSMLYSKLVSSEKGNIVILLNTSILPLDATVNTIKIQLIVLSVLLILLAFILAMIMYKRISKPIMEINESAKELAKGNYDIVFNGDGYLEISELSSTLNYASHELNKVETLRQELIANISHDLRTPLTMIQGYAEVMRDLPDENNGENAQIIINEATRLTSLVNDVLDLSKIQSGNEILHIEEYDITSSIIDILKQFNKFVYRDGYKIDFNYDKYVYIEADELRISQVIYNLINNALTYTGEDKRIVINQKVIGDYVRIEVCDSGIGIPEDNLDTIWNRYYKVKNGHRRAVNGTGLGLSIVKSILEAHNELLHNVSRYGVESKINEGSTFYFEYLILKQSD